MFVREISLLTVVVTALLPALARGQEADTALTRIQQNKAVTIGFRNARHPPCRRVVIVLTKRICNSAEGRPSG